MDNQLNGKVAVITVGLPATGKTFIARNLCRYLRWIGYNSATFSVARYRRLFIGDKLKAEFFDPQNIQALEKRTEIANKALNDMINWFCESNGQVGILDASNTTEARRMVIFKAMKREGIKVIFLECIYPRNHAVEEHIKELKMTCPEYEDLTPEEALVDFTRRIDYYRPTYASLDPNRSYSYVQIFDGGEKIISKGIGGFMSTKIVYFLMNIQPNYSRTIFLAESSLEPGEIELFSTKIKAHLWSDTRTDVKATIKPQLEPIEEGEVKGLEYKEIRNQLPEEYNLHIQDKYSHRYPRAESYKDLSIRLESIIMELEKINEKVIIYVDESVLKCVYAYYVEIKPKVISTN
jgi:6-phosphofructo-2-kinase/fructose-2,6-biphosphatase 4